RAAPGRDPADLSSPRRPQPLRTRGGGAGPDHGGDGALSGDGRRSPGGDQAMSLRDVILKFMSPKMRAEAEADSREWIGICPRCKAENSIWDVGGIRYKAAGNKISLVRCAHCGKTGFMRFAKRG